MRRQKLLTILGTAIFLIAVFISEASAWGPGGRWGRGWYGRWAGYNNPAANFVRVEGKITQVKTLPGPGRWGCPWIVVEVKDKAGKTYGFGIGPQWWGAPPELKPGAEVKISGFTPPGWAFRGVPFLMTCTVEFPKARKSYPLRPCGWWTTPYNSTTPSPGNPKQ